MATRPDTNPVTIKNPEAFADRSRIIPLRVRPWAADVYAASISVAANVWGGFVTPIDVQGLRVGWLVQVTSGAVTSSEILGGRATAVPTAASPTDWADLLPLGNPFNGAIASGQAKSIELQDRALPRRCLRLKSSTGALAATITCFIFG